MTEALPLTVFERSLRRQILFGSNYPRVEIKNMARALRSLGFSDECLTLIFRGNARRLLEARRPGLLENEPPERKVLEGV
jgi:predicted TIM-barrel fold metal-dependent hydrolase